MPQFTFDLESFTTITLEAENEAAARAALEAVLAGMAGSEYLIDQATRIVPGADLRSPVGRPPDARARRSEILRLRDKEGLGVMAISRRLNLHRTSVWRVLKG